MKQKFIFFNFLFILIGQFAIAQQYYISDYSNKPFFKSDIYAIMQSKNGIMWVSTVNGIVKYAANDKVKIFSTQDGSSAIITSMLEDRKGDIWGTSLHGIYKINGNYLEQIILPQNALNDLKYSKIIEDFYGNIWVTTRDRLVSISQTTMGYTAKEIPSHNSFILTVFEKAKNEILVGTTNGICKVVADTLQQIINIKTGVKHTGVVFNIFKWYNGKIYFTDNNLNLLNTDNTYKECIYFGKEKDVAINLSVDNKNLVITSNVDSIKVYNEFSQIYSLSIQNFNKYYWTCALFDNIGNIWLGQLGGLVRLSHYPVSVYTKLPQLNLNQPQNVTIFNNEAKDGDIFVATNKYNFYNFNIETKSFSNLNWSENIKKVFPEKLENNGRSFNIAHLDRDNKIILDQTGFFGVNNQTKKITTYPVKSKTNAEFFVSLKDKDTLWMAGSSVVKLVKNKVTYINDSLFANRYTVALSKIKNCDSLILGGQMGLVAYANNKASIIASSYFTNGSSINSILEESDTSKLIFVDGVGIFRLSFHHNHFLINVILNSTNYFSNFKGCFGILDANKKVYVKLNDEPFYKLLQKVNDKYFLKTVFFSENILNIHDVNNDQAFFDKSNYFWENKGQVYKLNLLDSNFYRPPQPLKIVEINISNYQFNVTPALDYTSGIKLNSIQNTIAFNFVQLDLNNTAHFTYEYYLEGIDETPFINVTTENDAIYRNLGSGKYVFHVRSRDNYDKNGNLIETTFAFTILPPWYKTWWAILLWASLFLIFLWLVLKWRIKEAQKNANAEKLLAEHELISLKAQLNPHFIQNTFDLMARRMRKNDTEGGIEIMHKVSEYLRNVVAKSDKSAISLEDELENTEEYLKMQQIVYPNLFDYTIDLDDNVDIIGIFVPAMLLQPIVENCIKHGFRKIEHNGKIDINIQEINNIISINIKDNGCGLNSEGAIKGSHKGIALTTRRMELLYKNNNNVVITLSNRNDGVQGTEFKISFIINKIKNN